jgi:hypothetical protein
MSVQRYLNEMHHGYYIPLTESQDGQFVLYYDYVTLLAEHTALREAVEWERECEWLNDRITERYAGVREIASEEEEISVSYLEARAEVDRLLGGE